MCEACDPKKIAELVKQYDEHAGQTSHVPLLTPNRWDLPGVSSQGGQAPTGYHLYETARPVVLVPLGMVRGVIRSFHNTPPTTGDQNVHQKCYRAFGGRLALPFPGRWYIRHDNSGTNLLPMLVLDRLCDAAVQEMKRYVMAKPVTLTPVTVGVIATDIVSTIDPDSVGTVMQNSGANRIYFRLDTAAADPAVAGTSAFIEPGGSVCLKWNAYINGIGGGASDIIVTRLY